MKVLLIDDHPLFRDAVAAALEPLVASKDVMHAGSCEEAFDLLDAGFEPDFMLVDINLPGMSGIEGLRLLHQRHDGRLPLVALSSSDDRATVLQALDAGAMGFIPKSTPANVLLGALHLILAGGIYLPPSVFLGDVSAPHRPPASPGTRLTPADLGLTGRKVDVLRQILLGKSVKLIARDLDLSASTVKAYTSDVLRALDVTTRTQAVVAASRLGLRCEPDSSRTGP